MSALKNFPSCKRIVYSTCSNRPEENEQVIEEVLSLSESRGYSLVDCSSKFKPGLGVGSEKYSFAKNCLSLKDEIHTGKEFFIAVFERTEEFQSGNKSAKLMNEDKVPEEGIVDFQFV
jgi:16S rRNA C967 or C1407 C5-methylase (RsmB/RsmF family)